MSNEHTHLPDSSVIDAKIIKSKIKENAIENQNAPKQVIGEILSGVDDSVIGKLPSLKQLAESVTRYRRDRKETVCDPESLAELVLNGEYLLTAKGNQFLLHDNNCSNSRVIIFASDQNLRFLSNCTDWFMDGNFKIAPKFFQQMYTIHGIYSMKIIGSHAHYSRYLFSRKTIWAMLSISVHFNEQKVSEDIRINISNS